MFKQHSNSALHAPTAGTAGSTHLLQGCVVSLNDAREHALHAHNIGALVV